MSGGAAHSRRNRFLSWLVNLVGVLAFVIILYWGGAEAWRQMIRVDLRYLLASLAATLLWNLVAAYRWSLLTNRVAGRTVCPYRYYFTYHMIGMVTGQVLPITAGMLGGRPVALSLSQGVPLKRTALSVLLDKLFDLFLALVLVGPVALYLVGWISLPLGLGLMGAAAIAGALLLGWRYEQVMRWFGLIGIRLARILGRVPVIGSKFARRLPQQLERLTTEAALSNRLAVPDLPSDSGTLQPARCPVDPDLACPAAGHSLASAGHGGVCNPAGRCLFCNPRFARLPGGGLGGRLGSGWLDP
jgi:hypothetical protein